MHHARVGGFGVIRARILRATFSLVWRMILWSTQSQNPISDELLSEGTSRGPLDRETDRLIENE